MKKGGEGNSGQREWPVQRLGGKKKQGALGALWQESRWWGRGGLKRERSWGKAERGSRNNIPKGLRGMPGDLGPYSQRGLRAKVRLS